MSSTEKVIQRAASTAPLALSPLNATSLRDQAYALLKTAIADTDIYNPTQELRLDERQLTAALGVSRTPIREALSLLEQEGFIRTIPRRGIYIVRKSKREIIEMIQMWAALESMAARLATLHAPDSEIARLRHLFDEFKSSPPSEHLDEYSDANIAFHT
jgi:DNA-binding GntR family transcriptional regulator